MESKFTTKEIIDICNEQVDRANEKSKFARSKASKEAAKSAVAFFSSIATNLKSLESYKDSTCGLFAIDKDPKDVDIDWIRENASRIDYIITNKQN